MKQIGLIVAGVLMAGALWSQGPAEPEGSRPDSNNRGERSRGRGPSSDDRDRNAVPGSGGRLSGEPDGNVGRGGFVPGGFGPGGFGPGGFGPGGFGPGGMMGQDRLVVKQFDSNQNGWLETMERKKAREFLKSQPNRGPGGPGGPPGFGPGGRGFDLGSILANPLLEFLDTDKNSQLDSGELEKGSKRFISDIAIPEGDGIEPAALADDLSRILPPPPNFFGGRGGPGGPPGGAGPGFGPPGGGGFGPANMLAGAVVLRADKDKNGKASPEELRAAAIGLAQEADKNKDGKLSGTELSQGIALLMPGRPGGMMGPPGGMGSREAAKPGPKVLPDEVQNYDDEPLYDLKVLRTLFLEFENPDWETELADFHGTDVEVPATLTVDGKKYTNVGIHFRGMSSYGMVPAGSKRSFNVAIDFVDGKQRLLRYRTLNLLNAHEDPTFMSSVLYSHIARKHIPAPKANFVKVVINGESWGVYVNTQQFNKEFIAENFENTRGTRWKVRGSPGGGGGLEYLGENIEEYQRRYEMKSGDGEKAWREFVNLCRILNETPADQLEAALAPILNIEETLWFLALDVALINNDGYWVRASDYSIYRTGQGQFHFIPHDMNEAFHGAGFGPGGGGPGGGPGRGGMGGFGPGGFGPGGARPGGRPPLEGAPADRAQERPEQRNDRRENGPRNGGNPRGGGPRDGGPGGMGTTGVELDPLVALDDPRKPLRSKLLAVPSLRARYLEYVRTIAEEDLDWKKLEPVIDQLKSLIDQDIKLDTRKLTSYAEFEAALNPKAEGNPSIEGRRRHAPLRIFLDQRRAYLLKQSEIIQKSNTEAK